MDLPTINFVCVKIRPVVFYTVIKYIGRTVDSLKPNDLFIERWFSLTVMH